MVIYKKESYSYFYICNESENLVDYEVDDENNSILVCYRCQKIIIKTGFLSINDINEISL